MQRFRSCRHDDDRECNWARNYESPLPTRNTASWLSWLIIGLLGGMSRDTTTTNFIWYYGLIYRQLTKTKSTGWTNDDNYFWFDLDLQTLPVKLAERHNSLRQLLWPPFLFLPSQPWYSTEDRPQHRELRALLLATSVWVLLRPTGL